MADYSEIEQFVRAELAGRKHPGSSVSLIKDGKLAWAEGFGYANVREGTLATPETIYGCASVTKPVVTIGFLQLMEKGKFNLDDKVNTHLDIKIRDIKGEEPIIKDLLTHYTGMPTRVPPLYLLGEATIDARNYIEEAARMVRPRNQVHAYCNTSFTIIGYLIHQFTGVSYDKYLKKHVLTPLEMTSSEFELTPKVVERLAQGYKRAGGPDNPLIPSQPYVLGMKPADPAGSLYSTALDLAKFIIMNINSGTYKGKRLIKEETIKEMQRLQVPTGKSNSGMGLTWFRTVHDGHTMLYHTGGLPDYTNNVCFYPNEGVGVCWLSNLQDGSGWRPPAPTILRITMGDQVKQPNAGSPEQNWEKIVGDYGDDIAHSSIRVVNGLLTLDDMATLLRLDDTRYKINSSTRDDGEELTLEYGEDGYVEQIDIGTTYLKRLRATTPEVDYGINLIGTWVGESVDSYGFHPIELRVLSNTSGVMNGSTGEYIHLEGFRAELGHVTGQGRFRIPTTYARWGTKDFIDITINLKAIDNKLKGFLVSHDEVTQIEFIMK